MMPSTRVRSASSQTLATRVGTATPQDAGDGGTVPRGPGARPVNDFGLVALGSALVLVCFSVLSSILLTSMGLVHDISTYWLISAVLPDVALVIPLILGAVAVARNRGRGLGVAAIVVALGGNIEFLLLVEGAFRFLFVH